jgi:hypothetical protein
MRGNVFWAKAVAAQSARDRRYAASREDAMAPFKAAWACAVRRCRKRSRTSNEGYLEKRR